MMDMRLIVFVATVGSFLVGHVQARVNSTYGKWAKGEFTLPVEISEAKTTEDLSTFLGSSREFTRMAAVRRLGEIQGSRAIPHLMKVFQKERSPRGLDYVPLVKLEVVRTLGRVGGQEAKLALLRILENQLEASDSGRANWLFMVTDLAPVGHCLASALEQWRTDDDVVRTADRVATDDTIGMRTVAALYQWAWRVHLGESLKRDGLVADREADAVWYLLHVMHSAREKGQDAMAKDRAAAAASAVILSEVSATAMQAVNQQVDRELSQMQGPDRSNARYRFLRWAKACLHEIQTKEGQTLTKWSLEQARHQAKAKHDAKIRE